MKDIALAAKRILLLIILVVTSFALYGCSDNPVPERTVLRNLRREFPDGNFQLEGLTTRRVPAFPYFHFDFQRDARDVHVVRCLDYDITFTTLDGRSSSYLQRLLSSHLSKWNEQLIGAFENAHPNAYNARANISLHTSLNERSVHNSHTTLNVIADAHLWLMGVASFEEGFATVASYERVGGVFFNVSYDVILNEINIDEEIASINTLVQDFVLPYHGLVAQENKRTVTRLQINFMKDGQDVRLGRFEWVHDSIADDALSNMASHNLIDFFEIMPIYDELSLLETASFEEHKILGTWGWRSHPMRQYHFYEDGTGRLSYGGGRDFIWRISEDDDGENLIIIFEEDIVWTQSRDGNIHITYGTDGRAMPLVLDESTLEMRPSDNRAMSTYIRVESPTELHGTWAWEIDANWLTVMNADGTGQRGFPDEIINFRWTVEEESRQLRKFREMGGEESWSYEFEGDTLVLINWYTEDGQQRGQRFFYTRIE